MRIFPNRHPPRIRFSLAWLLVAFTAAVLYVAWHAHSVRQSEGVGIERPSPASAADPAARKAAAAAAGDPEEPER